MKDAFIDRIEFGQGDDDRVIIVGTDLPFRFGKIEDIRIFKDAGMLTIRISRDTITEASVDASPKPSLLARLKASWNEVVGTGLFDLRKI